jgi:hypothetical protein
MPGTHGRPVALGRAAALGGLAGLLGAGVMAVGERAEQAVTHRPDSYVPGRTLRTLFGRPIGDDEHPTGWNAAMHYGTGAVLGALRGVWAATGLRGPRADLAHTVARLSFDQTLENASGAGAPPHTWPVREQVVDTAHKAVFAFVTGTLADRLIRPGLESRRGTTSH